MTRRVASSAAFINSFGVTNPRFRILNLLKLNGGTMCLGDVMEASTEPHEVVVYTVSDFLDAGLIESNPASPGGMLDPELHLKLTEQGRQKLQETVLA